jgi:ABC-type dipeptide/oligopeptide/nickel transport system permease component
MARFLAKRVLYELLTLFLIVTATFFLIAGAPGTVYVISMADAPPLKVASAIRTACSGESARTITINPLSTMRLVVSHLFSNLFHPLH